MALKTQTYVFRSEKLNPEQKERLKNIMRDFTFKQNLEFSDLPDGRLMFEWEAYKPGHDEMCKRVGCINLGLNIATL